MGASALHKDIDVSVVIGFKDWGINRLSLAVKSIQGSFGTLRGEVIVSDYGSASWKSTKTRMEELGATYVRTETDGKWSRSRALNAGFAVSKGKVLISTDADMVFSPKSMEVIGSRILEDPTLCILLQCRDLPETWSDVSIAEKGMLWPIFEEVSRIRPRWGMGGMMAVPRGIYMRIRGLDERMHTYGGEDIDFATRARRAGQRLLWLDDPDVRMYHMWHPLTREVHKKSVAAEKAIQFNKEIVYKDDTFVRNTPLWLHKPNDAPPLVSVSISTYNRAEYLRESLNSVLCQTMQDFEIVIVDDGSTDDTRAVVESFHDERIRYFYQDNSGISVARNRAADESKGFYTVVHDDDDLMTPWRLEKHFEHLTFGSHGTFGSFVNFDNVSGEMKLYASKILNDGTIFSTGGAPGHGTWMVETELLRQLRYDETLSSGVDNNMALRLVRSGTVLHHTGEIMMLRRMHDGQITQAEESTQRTSARQTRQLFSYQTTKWGGDKLLAERGSSDYVPVRLAKELDQLVSFLPDHLVRRTMLFTGAAIAGHPPKTMLGLERGTVLEEYDDEGVLLSCSGVIDDAQLEDLAHYSAAGIAYEVTSVLRTSNESVPVPLSPERLLRETIHHKLEELVHGDENASNGVAIALLGAGLPTSIDGSHVFIRQYSVSGRKISVTFITSAKIASVSDILSSQSTLPIEIIAKKSLEETMAGLGLEVPAKDATQR